MAGILEVEGLAPWIEPVPFLVRDAMWMQEVILRGFGEGKGERFPVAGADLSYRGELAWDRARSRSFIQWEGVRVADLEDLAPGPAIDWADSSSQILEVLGRAPEGAPVLRGGRVAGFLRAAPLYLAATVDGYLDGYVLRKGGEGEAIAPEFSLPRGGPAVESKESREGDKPSGLA